MMLTLLAFLNICKYSQKLYYTDCVHRVVILFSQLTADRLLL